MANKLKVKRGTNLSNITTAPEAGELIYKSNTNELFVGDGSTPATGLTAIGGTEYTAGTGLSLSGTEFSLGNHSGDLITSGTVAAARIAGLPASKITSGAFDIDRLPTAAVTNGDFDNVSTANAIYDFVTGQGYLTSVPNHSASLITSGTLNNARLNTDMQLSSAAPRYKLQETGVTNTPVWWMIADGGNYSIRLNNTGNYPMTIVTNGENNAVSNITLGYSTSITGSLNINNRFTSTGNGGFTIGNYSGYDRIQNSSNSFSFLTDGNGYANMTFGTVTAGTWNGSVIASAYLDADTAHLSGTQTFSGTKTFSDSVRITGGTKYLYLDNDDESLAGLWFRDNQDPNGQYAKIFFNSGGSNPLSFYVKSSTAVLQLASSTATVNGNIAVSGTVDGRDVASDGSKLDGIESGATADQTAAQILTAIKTVDGTGTGLDADLLDGLQGSSYWTKSGSWVGDLASNGYTRVQGVSNGGGEFVLALKNGQLNTLIDGSYFAYEGSSAAGGGFWSSYNSAYGNATGFKATGTNTIKVIQQDGGDGNLTVTGNITAEEAIISTSRDEGVFGVYDSTKTDHIWSMGTAYRNSSTGADFGNLYGLAYKHVNNTTGGNMAGGHQMVWVTNGTPRGAIGEVSIWSKNYFQAAGNYGGSWDTNNNTALTFTASSSGTAYNVLRCDTDNGFKLQTLGGTGGTQRWYTSGSNYIQFTGTTITASLNGTASNSTLLNNLGAGSFLRSDANDTFTGTLTGSRIDLGYAHGASNSIGCSNWFRSSGQTGWYNGTYGGGIRMTDTTWVRVYNSKAFYVANQIAATGDVTAYYSDERLKTKIETIDNAVDKVMSLEGFIYEENELAEELGYTNKGKRQAGVSAQQVQKVLPEAVTLAAVDMETDKYSGEITSKSGENYLTVKYEKIVPLLIEAIKEQQVQINELKTKLGE